MEHKLRIGQDVLKRLYDDAQERIVAYADASELFNEVLHQSPSFSSEKEALRFAIKEMTKDTSANFQVWAQIEKKDDLYIIANLWIASDDWKAHQAADFMGMALIHDAPEIRRIIADNIKIDDVIAY